MKREFLQNLGLEKDQIDTIMSEHGKSVADVNARLKSAQESQEALQAQLAERDKDMKELKKSASDNADLKKKYEDLESKYKADKAQFEQQIKDSHLDHAIDMALSGKVHDTGLVRGLLDRAKLELSEDGAVKGLDEQVEGLRTNKGFLFVPESTEAAATPKPSGASPAGGHTTPPSETPSGEDALLFAGFDSV